MSTCTPDAVTAELPETAPEEWKRCLDGHRMGGSGTSAAAPGVTDLFTKPSANPFSQAYYPAFYGVQYECSPWDLEDWPSDYYDHRCYDPYDPYDPYDAKDARNKDLRPQYGCDDDDPTILPLSTDHTAVIGAIDGLSAVGFKTFSALGVLWGQRMLLSSWRSVWGGDVHPVDPTSDAGKGVRKVIVLLTDSRDSVCNGDVSHCDEDLLGISRADAYTQAKKAGIEIFVVAAMPPSQVSSDLAAALTNCSSHSATSDITYTFLNNATTANLQTAFESIANQLRVVRRVH